MPGEDPRPPRSRRALPWPLLAGLGIGAAALVIGIGRLTAPTEDPVVDVPTPVLAGEGLPLPVEPEAAPGEPSAPPLTASPPPTGPPATATLSSTSTTTNTPPPMTGAPASRAAASAPEATTQPTAQDTTSAASRSPAAAEIPPPAPAAASPPDEPLNVVIVEDEPAPTPEVEPPPPAAPVLLGTWTGSAGGQPLKVQVLSQDEESVSGIFLLGADEDGPAARFRGRIDPGSRRLRLVELGGAGRSLQGQVADEGMTGTLEGMEEGDLAFSLQRR